SRLGSERDRLFARDTGRCSVQSGRLCGGHGPLPNAAASTSSLQRTVASFALELCEAGTAGRSVALVSEAGPFRPDARCHPPPPRPPDAPPPRPLALSVIPSRVRAPKEHVRIAAYTALAELGLPETKPILEDGLLDASVLVRARSAEAIGKAGLAAQSGALKR